MPSEAAAGVASRKAVFGRDWAAIRATYEAYEGTVKALAAVCGIPHSTLAARAKHEGWKRNTSVRRRRKNGALGVVAQRGRLLRRLYATLDRKVQDMEASLENNADKTIADHERETRTIGSLIRNVEKVHDLDPSVGGGSAAATQSSSGFAGGTTEEDVLRRELAARIQRLRERVGK